MPPAFRIAAISVASILMVDVASASPDVQTIVGAWASGDTEESCDSAPITYFSSDGVVAIFLKKDGAVHSIGSWSSTETEVAVTHNDFPLKGDGLSKPPVTLQIVRLDETHFVTRNKDGVERSRVRCADLEIGPDHGHAGE